MSAGGERATVLLWGPPGSGKSTVGPRLAAALDREFIDLDAVVEARAGAPASRLIAERGEGAFRALEREALDATLGSRAVVSLGGGALLHPPTRRDALKRAWVVSLRCDREVLLARLGSGEGRPLLRGDLPASLDALLALRAGAYAEAHAVVDATPDVDVVCDSAASRVKGEAPLVVPLGERTHRVVFAPLSEAAGWIERECPGGARALVLDARVASPWGGALRGAVGALPELRLTRGERGKTLATAQRVWELALSSGLDREGVLLALGGGVTTDLAGFAAALLHRGLRWVSLPTSLLAVVDAAVGGKTAVDLPRGKNLVGAFHHPSLALVDLAALSTLPEREWRSGMAEALKVGLTLDPEILTLIEDHAAELRGRGPWGPELHALAGRVARRAVQAKVDVVAGDEREGGARAVLNFGHTVGHAVEHASGYRMRHGECVAVGMVAALELGVELGVTPPQLRDRGLAAIAALGLPRSAAVDPGLAAAALEHDKKRSRGAVKMVLASGPGAAVMVLVPMARVRAAMESVLETRAP